MVRIINAHERKNDKGTFMTLELLGDIELIQSQNSGRFYATARRCSISTTFDHETAKNFIGQSLPGAIGRVPCEPYSYKLPESGETITLSHTYSYIPPQEQAAEADERPFELDAMEV